LQEDKLQLIFLIALTNLPGGDPAFPTKDTQRGGSAQKDVYYFTGLNIMFRPHLAAAGW
jgi:hypothetical protein